MNLGWMHDFAAGANLYSGRISVPFNALDSEKNRWRVATDGHLMVCVEIGDLPFPDGSPEHPDVAAFLDCKPNHLWTGAISRVRHLVGKPVESYQQTKVRIDSEMFSQFLVARVLTPLDDAAIARVGIYFGGGVVRVEEHLGPLVIDSEVLGRRFRAFVMPMRPDPEELESIPRIELNADTH